MKLTDLMPGDKFKFKEWFVIKNIGIYGWINKIFIIVKCCDKYKTDKIVDIFFKDEKGYAYDKWFYNCEDDENNLPIEIIELSEEN